MQVLRDPLKKKKAPPTKKKKKSEWKKKKKACKNLMSDISKKTTLKTHHGKIQSCVGLPATYSKV